MPQIKSGFVLRSTSPNFSRDSFATLEEMRGINPGWMPVGHISYCKETKSHYKYDPNNEYNSVTGKFRLLETGGGSSIIEQSIIYDTLEEMKSLVPTEDNEIHKLGQIVFCRETQRHYFWGYDSDAESNESTEDLGYFKYLTTSSNEDSQGSSTRILVFTYKNDLYNASINETNKFTTGQIVYVRQDESHYYFKYDEGIPDQILNNQTGYFEKVDKYLSFNTLKDMASFDNTYLELGQIAYCKENKTHYFLAYRDNNYDNITGYFRKMKGDPVDSNIIGGGSIHQSDTAPENKEVIWLDTTEHIPAEEAATIKSLQEAVRILSEELSLVKMLRTNGVISGTVSDSVRVELANSAESVKPNDDGLGEEEQDYSDLEEVEPDYEDCAEPTVSHISIKMGKWVDLQKYIKNYIPGELLWCTNKKKLYIYENGTLVLVAGGSADDPDIDEPGGDNSGSTDMDTNEIKELVAEQLQNVESIGFVPVGETEATYRVRVSEQGSLICYKKALDEWAEGPSANYMGDSSVSMSSLLINSFYLGGSGDKHSYQPCSHNFVEISNVWMKSKTAVQKDINLNGYYLLYLSKTGWKSLKLWGTIKANSSFVIRGAQCSVMDVNTTVIKVKNYDMEWLECTGYDSNDNPIWEPIKFDQDSAVFYLCWGDPDKPGQNNGGDPADPNWNPGYIYTMSSTTSDGTTTSAVSISIKDLSQKVNDLINVKAGACAKGFSDLASFNNSDICELETYKLPAGKHAKDVLFRRWYPMDPVGQSNPDDGLKYHNNMQYLTSTYLDGSNWNDNIPIEEWTPKASWEGKSMRETRSLFKEEKPNTLTITYGIQGSDNSENGGIGASRGFCWNTVGYYDEYLWIRKEGETEWEKVESLKDNVIYVNDNNGKNYAIRNNKKYVDSRNYKLFTWPASVATESDENIYTKYFTRMRWESSYGQVMTTHKVVLAGLKAGKYEYKVVRGTDETSSYQSKLRTFVVRADKDLKNFNYVQTTDQQGVTWEEWETWVLTARMMKRQYSRNINLPIPGVPEKFPTGKIEYQVDGRPTYVYSDDNNQVYESQYESDTVVIDQQTYSGVTEDESRAKRKDYMIGTIPDDYGFIINTGDICYNGSRSNEWLDYFYGQEPLDDREEMLTIGNNDLIPISMRDIGTGQESPWKINPQVIDYFYAVDFNPENPPIFAGISSDDSGNVVSFKIPGLYSFNYGDFHFISLLSEIRTISNKQEITKDENGNVTSSSDKKLSDSTVNRIFGIKDELRSANNKKASKIYDTVEGWIARDLMVWKGKDANYIKSKYGEGMDFDWANARFDENIVNKCTKCVLYTHEMPFNITSSNSYKNYTAASTAPRETAKAYLNRFHNFEFQRVFKLWGIPMVMGGHKHTCAMTRPVYDAPEGYNPITGKMHPKYYGEGEGAFLGKDGTPVSIGYYRDNDTYDQILNDNKIERKTETAEQGGASYYVLNTGGDFSNTISFAPFIQCTIDELPNLKSHISLYAKEVYNNSSEDITLSLTHGTYELKSKEYIDDLKHTYNEGYPRFRVEIVDKVSTPTYIMCQTSGFKNKSNSDLACNSGDGEIPWERFYVKGDSIREQCAPFYTVYNVKTVDENGTPLDDPRIEVNMYRVSGMYEDTGGDKGGSPAGYWSLANIYCHGETLEENRNYFTGVGDEQGAINIQKYGQTTIIKLQ